MQAFLTDVIHDHCDTTRCTAYQVFKRGPYFGSGKVFLLKVAPMVKKQNTFFVSWYHQAIANILKK